MDTLTTWLLIGLTCSLILFCGLVAIKLSLFPAKENFWFKIKEMNELSDNIKIQMENYIRDFRQHSLLPLRHLPTLKFICGSTENEFLGTFGIGGATLTQSSEDYNIPAHHSKLGASSGSKLFYLKKEQFNISAPLVLSNKNYLSVRDEIKSLGLNIDEFLIKYLDNFILVIYSDGIYAEVNERYSKLEIDQFLKAARVFKESCIINKEGLAG